MGPFNADAYVGPWGWQWRHGVQRVVSVPPFPAPIFTEALMDDIGKVRASLKARVSSVTDKEFLGCSRHAKNHYGFGLFKVPPMPLHGGRNSDGEPPQPPSQIRKREHVTFTRCSGWNEEVDRCSYRERKGSMSEGETYAVYPYSVDVKHIVDGLCGPRPLPESFPVDKLDRGSGTMSMDLGTEDGSLSIPSELPTPLKIVGSGLCKKLVGANRADGFPGRTP